MHRDKRTGTEANEKQTKMGTNQSIDSQSPGTGNQYAETRLFSLEESISRQEHDIAFAAALMQSGIVNERTLSSAVLDWSLYGSVSLAEHLLRKQILDESQISVLQQTAAQRIMQAQRSVASGSQAPDSSNSMLLATLERLDGSGRVAKLFGVTIAGRCGDDDARVMEGRYELIRKLGQGGLGRVWLARDVNLNRHVALKEISHTSGATSAIIERFKHEAEITGRLDHPSIVPIYQLGKDRSSGRVFYTMRFLGRTTLQDSISEYHERLSAGDDDPMLLRHLLSAFVNVCYAIGHAHSRKVIHRDLKPENVVIDSFGQVIVIDWGLAKLLNDTAIETLADSVSDVNTQRTNEGQVLGTPLYMAPEQAAGRLDELDHRTDIYGLGAILFAIVSGCAPHEKTQQESIDSGVGARGMISVIASGETPTVLEMDANIDPRLDAICRKAMAKRRYARYQSAAQLAEDVQRWMAGEVVSSYEEKPRQKIGRWITQHPRLSQTLIGAAMITLVSAATLGMSMRHNQLAVTHAQFAAIKSDVREVESQLRGVVTELQKNARFLASMPQIQETIRSLEQPPGNRAELQTLDATITAFLQSNPVFLAISLEADSDGNAMDVVRVERNPASPSLIRSIPKSQLRTVQADPLMAVVATLQPGDVKLSLEPRARDGSVPGRANRLSLATPVIDNETGEFFGMVVIEIDYSARILELMVGLGFADSEVYVADGMGKLIVSSDTKSGVQLAGDDDTIPDLPPAVASRLAVNGEPFRIVSDNEYVATRYYIDPAGRGILILARLPGRSL